MRKHSRLPNLMADADWEQARVVLMQSEVLLISCLFWWMDVPKVIQPRRLSNSLLYIPVQGRLRVRVGDREARIEPGQLMMVAEGVEHEARLDEGCDFFEAIAIHAHAYTTHAQPLLKIFRDPIGRIEPVDAWMEQLKMLTHLMGRDEPVGRRFGEPLLRALLLHQLSHGNTLKQTPQAGDARVWSAIYDILRHYDAPLRVSALAKGAGLSEVQFRKLFRRQVGVSPKAYIQQLRLSKAQAMLQTDPQLTVKEVAAMTGFGDPHYLHQVFREAYGISPGQSRDAASEAGH